MNFFKNTCFFLLALVISFVINSCEWFRKDEEPWKDLQIIEVVPSAAAVGDTVLIKGIGFGPYLTDHHVYFGDFYLDQSNYASNYVSVSSEGIRVIVPPGATSAPITVKLFDESASSLDPFFIRLSVISSILPDSAWVGDTVVIKGENFAIDTLSALKSIIKFDRAAVTKVIQAGRNELKVIVPVNATSGMISVGGTPGPNYKVNTTKTTSFYPATGPAGTVVTLKGRGYSSLSTDNEVSFNEDVQAKVLSSSSRELIVEVPIGATTGPIGVKVGELGTLTKSANKFNVSLSIFKITPPNASIGDTIVISGYNFHPKGPTANWVNFGKNHTGIKAIDLNANATEIKVKVPIGLTEGDSIPVNVTAANFISNIIKLKINPPGYPSINSINPASGQVGTILTITGKKFGISPEVSFGGAKVNAISVSDNLIRVRVPSNLAAGAVNVGINNGVGTTNGKFTVITSQNPVITEIIPGGALNNSPITIQGLNLGDDPSKITVHFGNEMEILGTGEVLLKHPYGPPSSASNTQLNTTIPSERKPKIDGVIYVEVIGSDGVKRKSNEYNFDFCETPVITSLLPTSGFAGDEIRIYSNMISGTNNSLNTKVKFGSTLITTGIASHVDDDGNYYISCKVPSIEPASVEVKISVGSGLTWETTGCGISNAYNFEIKERATDSNVLYWSALVGNRFAFYKGDKGVKHKLPEVPVDIIDGAFSLVYDSNGGKIYWIEKRNGNTAGKFFIRSANKNGSGAKTLIDTEVEQNARYMNDLVFDNVSNKLYWSENDETTSPKRYNIYYLNPSASNPSSTKTKIFSGSLSGIVGSIGLLLDNSNKIYWQVPQGSSGSKYKIMRANLDGSGGEEVITDINNLAEFHLTNDYIYFVHSEGSSGTKTISRRGINGGNISKLFDSELVQGLESMTIGSKKDYIYWIRGNSNTNNDEIIRAKFDGSRSPELLGYYTASSSSEDYTSITTENSGTGTGLRSVTRPLKFKLH